MPKSISAPPRALRSVRAMFVAAMVAFAIPSAVSAQDVTEGFEPLFADGTLRGWVKEGNAGFEFTDEMLVCTGTGDYPTWLRSEREYENFELRFQFRLDLYGESGIFIHAPLHGRNANVGFEVQLSDDTRNPEPVTISTGAIFAAVPPVKQNSHPLGAWNQVEILCDWPRLQVKLNGEVVQDIDCEKSEELRYRLRRGYLGIQDRGKEVQFRNFEIRELPPKEVWLPLFDGMTFDGWSILEPDEAQWRIENGEIVATDGNGYLLTEAEYQDFELHTYVRSTPGSNGGIFGRWKTLNPRNRGYEIQIEDIEDSNNPTGSIYDVVRAHASPWTPGEWYLMQIRFEGPTAVVRVNGETVARTDRLQIVRPGHIALQMHSRGKEIRFKGLKLKELAKPTP